MSSSRLRILTRQLSTMTAIPQTAKAVLIYKNGTFDEIKVEKVAVPQIKSDEILVHSAYAGINFIESYFISGLYKAPSFPYILGREGAGEVVKIGDAVKKFKVGDQVAYAQSNTAAEYAAIPESGNVVKIPPGMDMKTAAAAMIQALTAFTFTREAYPVDKGDFVLIHAAAGGTGALLVQFCKLAGATVIGTTSSPEKADIAKAAGADYIINYKEQDIAERVNEITGGKGVQGVFDGVGKDTWDVSMKCVARKGTIVSFGNASGAVPPLSVLSLSPKNVKVLRPILFNYIHTPEEWEYYSTRLFEYLESGKIKISISKIYPLSEFKQALTDLTGGKTTGKLIVETK